jgi:hypothetical protein
VRVRRPQLLGAAAVCGTVVVVGLEYAVVWRRGRAPLPSDTDHVLAAGREAARETVAVAREGYRATPSRELALLNLLLAFAASFGAARLSTRIIRSHGTFGPFRNMSAGGRHIHHFVPGIVLALLAGGASIVSHDEGLDRWLALPFGLGAALTLDEFALLLEFEDVYWTDRGVVSVQVALTAMALLTSGALARRLLRRGEGVVFVSPSSAGNGKVRFEV